MRTGRLFDILNMPAAVLGVLFVVVVVNIFLYSATPPRREPRRLPSLRRPSKDQGLQDPKRGRYPRIPGPRPPPGRDPHRSERPCQRYCERYLLSVARSRVPRAQSEPSRPFLPFMVPGSLWTKYLSGHGYHVPVGAPDADEQEDILDYPRAVDLVGVGRVTFPGPDFRYPPTRPVRGRYVLTPVPGSALSEPALPLTVVPIFLQPRSLPAPAQSQSGPGRSEK